MTVPERGRPREMKIGSASYSKEQWPKLLAAAADRERLEDTWEEWVEVARANSARLRAEGYDVREVPVDIDALEAYCRRLGLPNNGQTRARYVAARLAAEDVTITVRDSPPGR